MSNDGRDEPDRFIPCPKCGEGFLVPITGPSRKIQWVIGTKRVPDGMFVRTCSFCGHVLLDDEELAYLASI